MSLDLSGDWWTLQINYDQQQPNNKATLLEIASRVLKLAKPGGWVIYSKFVDFTFTQDLIRHLESLRATAWFSVSTDTYTQLVLAKTPSQP